MVKSPQSSILTTPTSSIITQHDISSFCSIRKSNGILGACDADLKPQLMNIPKKCLDSSITYNKNPDSYSDPRSDSSADPFSSTVRDPNISNHCFTASAVVTECSPSIEK
jgi:hypothetical protein